MTPPLSPPRPSGHQRERLAFEEFLERRGLKLTRQREAVMKAVLEASGHFEAEEVVTLLRQGALRVSRATVYRTLDLMKECQLVEKLDLGTPHSYYEQVNLGEHHDHLICVTCGAVTEFHDLELETVQAEVCRRHGFSITHHSLRIFGQCQACLEKTG
ncbi:MAG: transcriptional repressor [Deltaproteobacteria bacterium]|nr:transcriptional repressor [Deltaproteobacteria bacterium]